MGEENFPRVTYQVGQSVVTTDAVLHEAPQPLLRVKNGRWCLPTLVHIRAAPTTTDKEISPIVPVDLQFVVVPTQIELSPARQRGLEIQTPSLQSFFSLTVATS